MKLEINFGSTAFCVPGALIERLRDIGSTDLSVLLCLCADRALCTDEDAAPKLAAQLGVSAEEAERSIMTLRGMGLIAGARAQRRAPAPKKEQTAKRNNNRPFDDTQERVAVMPISMPEYSGEQIAAMIDKTPLYRAIVDETQKICGTMFTPTEVSRVISLADYLKLEFEHILMIFTFCKKRGKSSVQYAVKTAYTLYNQGIDTRAAFEEYVRKAEQFDTVSGRVRAIFGIGERALTAKEKELIAVWCKQQIPEELIERAYEITVNNTGKASMSYTGKVLENWCKEGYTSVEDVDRAAEEYRRQKSGDSSFESNEFFEAALKRGREKMGEG